MSKQTAQYSVNEALDLLSAIAEMELEIEPDVHLTHQQMVRQAKPLLAKSVEWIDDPDISSSVEKIRALFDVLYHYIFNRFADAEKQDKKQETIEGIKQMMLVIGSAAKKLDKFTDLFDHYSFKSASNLPEYKKLQQFYRKKIDHQVDQGSIARWILGMNHVLSEKAIQLHDMDHVFIDLETVVKDTGYELLLMRKEDGSRFFNPKLLRNIKLVSEFGSMIGSDRNKDLFFDAAIWQDRTFLVAAKNILHASKTQMRLFFKQCFAHKNHEWVLALSQAFMALMLASNSNHLLEHHAIKTSTEYFNDFQIFLRAALHCPEYQKFLAYPPAPSNVLGYNLLKITQTLCLCLYTSLKGLQQMYHEIDQVLMQLRLEDSATTKALTTSDILRKDYEHMQKALKPHSGIALARVVDWIEEGWHGDFDPLMQSNLPNQFFDVYVESDKITNLRIPCPVKQDMIHRVSLCEEYRAFLYALKEFNQKHLHFNLQDRTAWKEHSRSDLIEKLSAAEDFKDVLAVVTLASDTAFHKQEGDYADLHDAACFIEQFLEHLTSESSGYHFPEAIQRPIARFCESLCSVIHEIFYASSSMLDVQQRMDFISLVHLFVQFKCIELLKCQTYSMTCKDGVDVGPAASILQFVFWKLNSQKVLSDADCEYLNFMIYAPALLVRERAMLPHVFERMVSAIQRMEEACVGQGYEVFAGHIQTKLMPLYETALLNGIISFPKVS